MTTTTTPTTNTPTHYCDDHHHADHYADNNDTADDHHAHHDANFGRHAHHPPHDDDAHHHLPPRPPGVCGRWRDWHCGHDDRRDAAADHSNSDDNAGRRDVCADALATTAEREVVVQSVVRLGQLQFTVETLRATATAAALLPV